MFEVLDDSLGVSGRSSVTSGTHISCKLSRCRMAFHDAWVEFLRYAYAGYRDVTLELTGVSSTHESAAVRRSRCRDRQIWQPVARRFERSSWKIIDDRLGRSGARCDGRLALLCRASVLVFCRLASAVSCCRQIPTSDDHILATARRDRIRVNTTTGMQP
jgi:hypothetical protein